MTCSSFFPTSSPTSTPTPSPVFTLTLTGGAVRNEVTEAFQIHTFHMAKQILENIWNLRDGVWKRPETFVREKLVVGIIFPVHLTNISVLAPL